MESPLIEGSSLPVVGPVAKRLVPVIAAVVIAGGGLGYAVHERHSAQNLAVQDQQMTAQLNVTHSQLAALTAKVNKLATSATAQPAEAKPSPSVPHRATAARRSARARRVRAQDSRFKKMQSQLDAQGKEIEQTQADLASARTELGGSIAHTHDELVALEKKGERNYYEFDLQIARQFLLLKSSSFRHEGPLSLCLRKANEKHQYADLQLIVDDRTVTQKHVNLDQPVMFSPPGSSQSVEVVINSITKNHVHGYVSAPKYRPSELAAMSANSSTPAAEPDQATNSGAQPTLRQRPAQPGSGPGQQPPDPDSEPVQQ